MSINDNTEKSSRWKDKPWAFPQTLLHHHASAPHCTPSETDIITAEMYQQCIETLLLYLISKCVFATGWNHVTWQSKNLASSLTTQLCLH